MCEIPDKSGTKRRLIARRASLHIRANVWVDAPGADIVSLVGARPRDRLQEALASTDFVLRADDLAAIERAVPKGVAGPRRWIVSKASGARG